MPTNSNSKRSGFYTANQELDQTKFTLETLTCKIMEAHSLADPKAYDIIREYCTVDFLMENTSLHECVVPFSDNLDSHLRHVDAIKAANPSWQINVSNVTAVFNDYTREVTVWYTSGASGGADSGWNSNRESVGIMHWRRRISDNTGAGDWECYKHSAIRGGADLDSMI